ncbi:MAG: DUF3348 domain-containing protein [Betaproteobacteria bacterium HGW-Betaproteobacteria-12]|nr:MAG: DUF3348 domain-containing protein [Betaproteobacteria bacterium HGW-Betaproteobacteria-12]
MARGLQHATFNRSALVRVLSDALPEVTCPKYDFGERLGQWLDVSDALTLYSVLNTRAGGGTTVSPANDDLPGQLARVRRNLTDSIHNDGVFNPQPARIPFPVPLPNATPESAADFSPYHRYYLAHQRDMGAAITALRANARKALAGQSAAGRQLAELDAAFEKSLAARERNLLGNIPILLSKRFNQRHAEHRATLAAGSADDPASWSQAGSWLEAFCQDAQTVLLAELELRLKPVTGLIAALVATPGSASGTNETKPR